MWILYTVFYFHARIKRMILRKPLLAGSWYPPAARETALFLDGVTEKAPLRAPGGAPKGAVAAAAPHAGWVFSGAIAAKAVSSLDPGADTVAVIGGHLPAGAPPLFAEEEGVATPLGTIMIDREFRDRLREELSGGADRYRDNTVEVLLPMVRYFFPRAALLWIRLPAEAASFEAGKRLARLGKELNRNLVVLASTDLTHYGYNYDFTPRGIGERALRWVKEVNDAAFIAAVQAGDPGETLRRAEEDRSACSAGAVLGALGFARAAEAAGAELLAYGTSADAAGEVPDSFVGYAALGWYPR
jgi:AmmeMemoRadiSam system protein B